MSTTPAGVLEDAVALSSLRGVAHVAAVLYDDDGHCVVMGEIPYDGMILLARCSTPQEVEVLVMAIAPDG